MGLDMYLFRAQKKDENVVAVNNEDKIEEVMYWRKANHIHQWFEVNLHNVDNCGFSFVSKDKLQELIDLCKEVAKHRDITYSRQNLPTTDGFFFGSTEYDDWYYDDLEETATKLEGIINTTDFNTEAIMYHPWW